MRRCEYSGRMSLVFAFGVAGLLVGLTACGSSTGHSDALATTTTSLDPIEDVCHSLQAIEDRVNANPPHTFDQATIFLGEYIDLLAVVASKGPEPIKSDAKTIHDLELASVETAALPVIPDSAAAAASRVDVWMKSTCHVSDPYW